MLLHRGKRPRIIVFEEQSWRSDATDLQDFLQSYSHQDGVVLAEE